VNYVEKQIDVKKLAISAGLVWGSGVFFAGLLGAATGTFALEFINSLGSLYLGYSATYTGAVIGGVWALLDGAIAGALLGFIYNRL
jgi:hypothetical protein